MAEQFCICDDEWCFCTEIKEVPNEDILAGKEWTCPACRVGNHVHEVGQQMMKKLEERNRYGI